MFNKNLEAIDNPALKRRLSRISEIESKSDMSYCISSSNDYVLLKNNLPIDDLKNPRQAIQKMFENTIKNQMQKNDSIINFGIGLCYLLDETFNKYPSRIMIYEPDLNLLHFVLQNVYISQHLTSGRVYISNDLDEFASKLSSIYLTKDKVEIVYIPNYAIIKNKELLMLTQKVFDTCKTKMVDINTITKFSQKWLMNSILNLSFNVNNKSYLLSELENLYNGKTALIAGAGPSLADNINIIKEKREQLVIIAVNKVTKYLIQNELIPDFVVFMDAYNATDTLNDISGNLFETNCIFDFRADNNVTKFNFKNFYYYFSEADTTFTKLSLHNKIKSYESSGSASIMALISAIKMGFSQIILAGIDLAFKDNKIYANGEKINRISQNQIIVDNVKKDIQQVKSVTGKLVYTRADYAAFINHFDNIISQIKHNKIYNISSFGANLKGVINTKFNDIKIENNNTNINLENLKPFIFEYKDFMQEELSQINNIISILSTRIFSQALISAILKSTFVYQYMQADILNVLQKNFAKELAEDFIEKTKNSIKEIISLLQSEKLI